MKKIALFFGIVNLLAVINNDFNMPISQKIIHLSIATVMIFYFIYSLVLKKYKIIKRKREELEKSKKILEESKLFLEEERNFYERNKKL